MNGAIIIKLLKNAGFFSICTGESKKSQILFIFDGILINAAITITSGVFLSGYIVLLEGPDFLVGILNNSGTWASIVAIFSFLIYERMKKRKRLLVTLNVISRLLLCSIIFLPLVPGNQKLVLAEITVFVVIGNVLWGFYSIGSTVMMIGLLPKQTRSQYIYGRMFWLRISFTIATITMGYILDLFNKAYAGFLIVFTASLILSIADAVVIANVEEPEYSIEGNPRVDAGMFFEPIKNQAFRSFLIFIFLLYFCLTISTSFTSLYLVKYLKFDYGFISSINVIAYILMIVCTNFWSRIEKEKGLTFVLRITAVFVVFEVFIYSFLTNNTYYILYFAPIVSGIGYSGFNIAVLTYRYELIPENSKTIYEGWFGAVLGLSMLVSPVAGSIIMKLLPHVSNRVYQYSSFQLLYLISSICAGFVVYLKFYRGSLSFVMNHGKREIDV